MMLTMATVSCSSSTASVLPTSYNALKQSRETQWCYRNALLMQTGVLSPPNDLRAFTKPQRKRFALYNQQLNQRLLCGDQTDQENLSPLPYSADGQVQTVVSQLAASTTSAMSKHNDAQDTTACIQTLPTEIIQIIFELLFFSTNSYDRRNHQFSILVEITPEWRSIVSSMTFHGRHNYWNWNEKYKRFQ